MFEQIREQIKSYIIANRYQGLVPFTTKTDNFSRHYAYCVEHINLMKVFSDDIYYAMREAIPGYVKSTHDKYFNFSFEQSGKNGMEEVLDAYITFAKVTFNPSEDTA